MADVTPKLPDVSAPKNATIGDENLPDPREPGVDVVDEQVAAQVTGKPSVDPTKVNVFEVAVTTDEVITDPNSPLAVQVPDAGRGDLLLPIHRFVNARRPEDVFAEIGTEESAPSDEERAAAGAAGQTPEGARGKSS
jgi:hypothetical protein